MDQAVRLEHSLAHVAVVILFLFPVYVLSYGIYNVFFHPLRRFPGPRLWHSTFLFRHFSSMKGQLDWKIKELHDRYGDVVRFSPEELSFRTEQAWKDIYSYRDPPLIKDPTFYSIVKLGSDGATSIFNADAKNHLRTRKQLAYAFSEKALREQESSQMLVKKIDMVQWYNFTTFDLIGDLAIGKSFGCLKNSQYHSWVANIFQSIKIGPYIRTMATYTDLQRLMRLLAPKSVKQAREAHELYVKLNARERLDQGIMEERKDFLSYILKGRTEKDALSDAEITANCGFLILAGSETTATALSGTTFYLLTNPNVMSNVKSEIRNAFSDESEINFVNAAARLPYTTACFQEGLRLYPPGPTIAPRRTPRGMMTQIDGYNIPPWTMVGVHALSASHAARNFHDPTAFHPERWLPSSTSDPSSPFYHDHRGASQPFSVGRRDCLGKSLAYNEMRVIFSKLIWNFDLELQNESRYWNDQVTYTLWEKKELMVKLNPVIR